MVECSNTAEGCPHKSIPIDFLEVHEKFECEFRLVKCNLPGCTLQQPLIYKLLQIHQQFECQGRSDQHNEEAELGNLLSAREFTDVHQHSQANREDQANQLGSQDNPFQDSDSSESDDDEARAIELSRQLS